MSSNAAHLLISIHAAQVVAIVALARALILTRERLARLEGIEELRRHIEANPRPRLADLDVLPDDPPAEPGG